MAYLLAGAKVTTFKRVTFQLRYSTLHKKTDSNFRFSFSSKRPPPTASGLGSKQHR